MATMFHEPESVDRVLVTPITHKTIVTGVLSGVAIEGIDLTLNTYQATRWWAYRSVGFIGSSHDELEIRVPDTNGTYMEWPFEVLLWVAEWEEDRIEDGTVVPYRRPLNGGSPPTSDNHIRCHAVDRKPGTLLLTATNEKEARAGSYRELGVWGFMEPREDHKGVHGVAEELAYYDAQILGEQP